MADKQSITEIYKAEASKYDKTREIQWRLNLAFWTLIVLAALAKVEHHAELPAYVRLFVYFGFLVVYTLFIVEIKKSQIRSFTRMRNLAKFIIESKERTRFSWKEVEHPKASLSWAWELMQFSITTLLLFALEFMPVAS